MKSTKIFSAMTLLSLAFGALAIQTSLRAALDFGVEPRRLEDEEKNTLVKRFQAALKGEDLGNNEAELKRIIVQGSGAPGCRSDSKNYNDLPVRVCVTKTDEKITIDFISPSEFSELSLSGMTLESDEAEIDNYIKAFNTHYKNQAESPEKKLAVINEVLSKYTPKLTILPEDADKTVKIFHVKSTDAKTPEEFDLNWDGTTLTFKTNYFENALTLTMSEKNVIQDEITKVLDDVIKHLDRTKRFALSENQDDHNTEKELKCEDLVDEKKGVITILSTKTGVTEFKGEAKVEGELESGTASWKHNGNPISVTCKQLSDNGFDVIMLEVGLGTGFQPLQQPFFKKSLYDLKPVAESFYDDIGILADKIFGAAKSATG